MPVDGASQEGEIECRSTGEQSAFLELRRARAIAPLTERSPYVERISGAIQ